MDRVGDSGIKMDSPLKINRDRFLSTIHTHDFRGLYRVGLTGHPGRGKSLILGWLRQLGFATIRCDLITQKLYGDSQVQCQISDKCGFRIVNRGPLNSNQFIQAVKNHIGMDASRLKKVSQIMQPKILLELVNEFKLLQKNGQKCVIVEVPLLYETNWEKVFNCIIHVERDQKLVAKQLAQRGWSENYIAMILSQYYRVESYAKYADITLNNNFRKRDLWNQIKHIIKEL